MRYDAAVIVAGLNHLLNGAPWAKQRLKCHVDKCIAIRVFPLQFAFTIDGEGRLHTADYATADSQIQLDPLLAARIALGDPAATQQIKISGDTQLAADFGNILLTLDWDAEADLARIIGAGASHHIAKLARAFIAWQRSTIVDSAAVLTEYAQEETALITKRKHLETFIAEVDTLRDASARLTKRIDLLSEQSKIHNKL